MKNLNAVVESEPRQRQIKLKSILAENLIPCLCERQKRLRIAIRRRELTEILEILSLHGFQGDLAIVALQYIQDLGRAV